MPSKITVRFFRVMPGLDSVNTFTEALKSANDIEIEHRRIKLVDGYDMRLENLTVEQNGLVRGDFTRIVDDDFPAIVDGDELSELEADELGLCCAFLYDPALSVLAFQYDPKKVSPNRAVQYLREFDEGNQFYLVPATNEDAWRRFDTGTVRRIKVRVAEPNDFEFAGDSKLGESVTDMANAYDAPSIMIEIGMGHHKGSLKGRIKEHVKSLVANYDVRTLEVKTEEEEAAFSLLKDLLVYRDSVEIPSDPKASSNRRQEFVKTAYTANKGSLKKMFGDNG